MKKAALYVRVSTSDQQVGLQETELRQFAEQRGWQYVIVSAVEAVQKWVYKPYMLGGEPAVLTNSEIAKLRSDLQGARAHLSLHH
jgi:hypothetical protein